MANIWVGSLYDSVVDILKLLIAVTFPTEMLKEVLNIFVIGLKSLLRIAAKTSSAFHLNKFAAILDCTMWRVVEHCQGKVSCYVVHGILDMLLVSLDIYKSFTRDDSQ